MTLLEWTADPHGELKLKLNKNSVSSLEQFTGDLIRGSRNS